MLSQEQRKRFGRIKAGYESIGKSPRPTHGDLWIDGVIWKANLPFALLQYLRKKYIAEGVDKKRITLKYHKP